MAEPLVEVQGLAKTYPPPLRPLARLRGRSEPPREALRDVSFEIAGGEVVGLIGPNGAGKSTLLRILAGLLLPSSGTARVAHLDVVADRPRSRRAIGAALSEDRGLSPRITARENLRFFAALFGLNGREAASRIAELAERFEASSLLDRPVRNLSSGEKARLVLIRALLHRPQVVLLDELTRSLDPGAAIRLRRQIAREVADRGAAVLFASHDLMEVESLSRRVVLLDRGRCVAFGPFAEVRQRADEVFARAEA
ncbi:MAG: ABC transporter ATP-binding protein [Myxococcaceae bacterium]|nr:ABC transporter ATP-binding protein [Myxococcaceae bacterium]